MQQLLSPTLAQRITADLRRGLRGTVATADAQRDRLASDFGRVSHHRAAVVVRPADPEDLADLIGYAARHGLKVTPCGAAHSQGGQALSRGGILVDLHGFGRVEEVESGGPTVLAGSGVLWRDLTAAVLPHGTVPPVLTDNLFTTVGGTASVGGVGYSSYRFGAQLDNVVELEVVTGSGELVRCSDGHRPDLFRHALGGLGQFGVITRVRHRLRPLRPLLTSTTLLYTDASVLLADAAFLTAVPTIDLINAWATPVKGRWCYGLTFASEADRALTEEHEALIPALHPTRVIRLAKVGSRARALGADAPDRPRHHERTGTAYPGVDVMLPASRAAPFIRATLDAVPPDLRDRLQVLLLFFDRRQLRRPMFVTPEEERLVMLTMEFVVPEAAAPRAIEVLRAASDGGMGLGGKRYLPGWLDFELGHWRDHFGPYWRTVQEMKRRFDPAGVLSSVIPLDEPARRAPAQSGGLSAVASESA